ncbi:hypothetical protein AAC387_Pa01g0894 [Persea americana]
MKLRSLNNASNESLGGSPQRKLAGLFHGGLVTNWECSLIKIMMHGCNKDMWYIGSLSPFLEGGGFMISVGDNKVQMSVLEPVLDGEKTDT